MLKYSKSYYAILLILISTLFLSGCASKFEMVSPEPPPKYEKLGQVSGSATGSLGLVSTAYYVFPMALNSRIARAHETALSKAPGATALIDVTYEESWFWWIIGTARTVTISGEAIKETK